MRKDTDSYVSWSSFHCDQKGMPNAVKLSRKHHNYKTWLSVTYLYVGKDVAVFNTSNTKKPTVVNCTVRSKSTSNTDQFSS